MFIKKFSIIIFITGVLIAIFSGVFETTPEMESLKIVILVILGSLVGLLNIAEEEQKNFLIASIAFLVSSSMIRELLDIRFLSDSLASMLMSLQTFIAPAVLVIALKEVFVYASESSKQFNADLPSLKERHFLDKIWDMVVFFSVALVIVILVLQSNLFKLDSYPGLGAALINLDLVIMGIFLIDLIVIFRKSKSLSGFIKNNWIDIIAVLPLGPLVKIVKVSRVIKILKLFKANRGFKVFSKDSGFNKIMHPELNVGKKKKKKGAKKNKTVIKTKKVSKKKK